MARALLHVLTGPWLEPGTPPEEFARAVAAGGADVVQLREKSRSDSELVIAAAAMLAVVRRAGSRLVVDDRLDVALRSGADGLHVGPEDLPVVEARRLWSGILGASCRTVASARAAESAGADYLGVGPVFASASKPGLPPAIGLDAVAAIARAVRIPVIGIGGIDAGNAASVIRAGAAGVAVISAVAGRADPQAAVRELREAIDSF
jgi:thiamine-phosphate diphosphorylase